MSVNLVLDVGCGHVPRGDVNIDLFIKKTGHRSFNTKQITDRKINVKSIPNFIVASSEYLPFTKDSFYKVVSHHVLEHTDGFKTFNEMVRVTKHVLKIVCPNQVGCGSLKTSFFRRNKYLHKYPVNKKWFYKMAKINNLLITYIRYSQYLHIPNYYISLLSIPFEITFIARKPVSL